MVPDARKTLPVLRQEWESCTKCDLGVTRAATGGAFVFGEGSLGALMIIGEGPGKDENEEGRPFVGRSGAFLRNILELIGIKSYYLTNTVCCRSFAYDYDTSGQQKFFIRRGVRIASEQDQPPNPGQRAACFDRLHQEIYIVDPILIVTLGATAAETVLQRPVKILQETGTLRPDTAGIPGTIARIPGAGSLPSLTQKGNWMRKVRGMWVLPTEQSVVEYPVIPLLHPAFVLRNLKDGAIGSPKDSFAKGMSLVKKYYNAYVQTVYGEVLEDTAISTGHIDAAASDGED